MTDSSVDYRESHLAADKGEAYDRRFSENPHRAMMWQMEQKILAWAVETLLPDRPIRHLDFACGTGRILAYLEPRAQESVGVDLSPSMLNVARRRVARASVIEADVTRDDVLGARTFNLITAFRFFPNAQDTLRREAMSALVRHLDDDGYLIFNNHLNNASAMMRLAHAVGKYRNLGMDGSEVDDLVAGAGLEVVAVRHLGVMPSNDRYRFLPIALLRPFEQWASRYDIFRRVSQNLIYVCRRAES